MLRYVTIDGQRMRLGICEACQMRGLLQRKPMAYRASSLSEDFSELAAAEPVAVLELCVTCFETPPGFVSDNMRH